LATARGEKVGAEKGGEKRREKEGRDMYEKVEKGGIR
jgi:hypothetical protein